MSDMELAQLREAIHELKGEIALLRQEVLALGELLQSPRFTIVPSDEQAGMEAKKWPEQPFNF